MKLICVKEYERRNIFIIGEEYNVLEPMCLGSLQGHNVRGCWKETIFPLKTRFIQNEVLDYMRFNIEPSLIPTSDIDPKDLFTLKMTGKLPC